MPFKVLALAPFRPQEENPWRHEPIRIDKMNVDRAIEDLGLSLYIPLPKNLCASGGLSIRCQKLKDFQPDRLIETHPFLKNLLEARNFAEGAGAQGLSEEEVYGRLRGWPDLPSAIEIERPKPKTARSSSPVDDILKMVALPEESASPTAAAQSFSAQVDSILQQILGHIFASEEFKNLESVWLGLRTFLRQGKVDGAITLEIVPVSRETLEETLTHLTAVLIESLPSLVLLDLPLDNSPRSLELLEKIALFAETLMVPTIFWITPKFFYLNSWQELPKLPFIPHYLEEQAFAKWRRLQGTPSAKWIAATCNRFLGRYPYGPENKPGLVRFEEREGLWSSPVWAAGSVISQSVLKNGWPTRFTEWPNTRLENLALHSLDGDKFLPTEVFLSEDRIDQFIRGGIIPLVATYNKDMAFIPSETTVAGASLSYLLLLSRITQFLFWCKENFEKDLEGADIEKNLTKAFFLFWEKTGHPHPQNLSISASKPKPEKPIIVRIVIEPSRQILPSGEKVELELNWSGEPG